MQLFCPKSTTMVTRCASGAVRRVTELLALFCCLYLGFSLLFVSNSQVIGCEDRLQNDLHCVGWGVKLCSIKSTPCMHFALWTLIINWLILWLKVYSVLTD